MRHQITSETQQNRRACFLSNSHYSTNRLNQDLQDFRMARIRECVRFALSL